MAEDTQERPPQTDPETEQQTEGSPQTQDSEATAEAEEAEAEKLLPPGSVQVEEVGTLRKKVTVAIPRAKIDAKRDEMFGELGRTAQVPGFRIGRAPRRLIERRFGREVGEDVRNALVGESLGEAVEQVDLKVLGEPKIDLEKIELPDEGDMEFSFEVEVAPEFDLPELKGIKVEQPHLEVTDERIDQHIDRWRQMQARYEVSDGPGSEGDAVTVDVRISGEGMDEVQRKDLSLRVAPGQVEGIPLVDLGKALEGKKAGETASVTMKVPEAHPNETWRGKEANVEFTVTQVRRRILPELDENFARSLGFDSVAALRQQVARDLESAIAAETRRSMREQVSKHLMDNTEFDLPEGVVGRHTATVLQRRYVELLQRGVPREKIDENLTELQAAASQQAKQNLKLSFILGKVAEREGVEVKEDEVNARVADMARRYDRRPERLRQELANDGTLEQVEVALREEKALERLLEQAEVTEIAPEREKKEPKKASKKKKAPKPKAKKKPSAKKAVAKKTPAKKTSAKKTSAKKSKKRASKKEKEST